MFVLPVSIDLSGVDVEATRPAHVASRPLGLPVALTRPLPRLRLLAPPVVLTRCAGGWIPAYLERGRQYRRRGARLVIDGPVSDACAVMLDRNRDLACLGPRASFDLRWAVVNPWVWAPAPRDPEAPIDGAAGWSRSMPWRLDVVAWVAAHSPAGRPDPHATLHMARGDLLAFYRPCEPSELP